MDIEHRKNAKHAKKNQTLDLCLKENLLDHHAAACFLKFVVNYFL